MIAIGVLFVAFGGPLQAVLNRVHFTHAPVQSSVDIALFFAAVFIVFGVLFFRAAGPGIVSAEITNDDVTFQYSGNRNRRLTWSDPEFTLRIDRTDETRARTGGGPPSIS
jgi:hypothetical protein